MKIRSLSTLTRTYVLALSLIAFLTLAIVIVIVISIHQVILTQVDSARLVNVSGSQRFLSQKIALLSVELVYALKPGDLDLLRQELLALGNEPAHLLTPDNPHLTYILQNRENLLESLDQIVSLYQQESEAKVQRLQMLKTTSGVIILLTLAFLGLYIFRPLANTLLKERAQLEHVNQELNFFSSVDGLTGIPNRRRFDQFLSQLWSLAARNGEPIALIMCDIDFFKAYNDTYGHLQGDECLKKIATALKESIKRPSDLVARYGGEEFVVVLPNTDVAGAVKVAESLRANIEKLEIPNLFSSVTPKVTISLGVSIGFSTPGVSPLTLIVAADNAFIKRNRMAETATNRPLLQNKTIIKLN